MENLMAILNSSSSSSSSPAGGEIDRKQLSSLMGPDVELMQDWLMDWFFDSHLRSLMHQSIRPKFFSDVGTGQDADMVIGAMANLSEEFHRIASKAEMLASALQMQLPEEWNHLDRVVQLFVSPCQVELGRFLAQFTQSYFDCHSEKDDASAFQEAAKRLELLQLHAQMEESAAAAIDMALTERLQAMAKQWEEPQVEALLEWQAQTVVSWLTRLFREPRASGLSNRVNDLVLSRFLAMRTDELFDIIVGFPEETSAAVHDIRLALTHLPANRAAQELNILSKRLGQVVGTRLLHPGANTAAIISTYQLAIHVLRVVDPSGVTLDKVAAPIRAYLVQRSDTIRCIVQSLTDPGGDLYAELCKSADEVGATGGAVTEDWVPEPADGLPQSDGVSRKKDVVDLLINIFGGSDPFVVEFKSLLGQRLLSVTDYNVDGDIRNLELLKLRFGEASLHDCEIMLHDMANSKRINKHVLSTSGPLLHDFSATIVSYLFWPSQTWPMPELVVSEDLRKRFETYEQAYGELKATRKLQWNMALGEVSLDVELPSGRLLTFEGVSLLQATLLDLFQSQASWSLEAISERTKVTSKDALRRAMLFWVGSGIVKEQVRDVWTLQLEDTGAARVANADEMMQESDDEEDDDLTMAEPFVMHMLTNLGALTVQQIQDQLKNFADLDVKTAALRDFLEAMCREDKITKKDGKYSPL